VRGGVLMRVVGGGGTQGFNRVACATQCISAALVYVPLRTWNKSRLRLLVLFSIAVVGSSS